MTNTFSHTYKGDPQEYLNENQNNASVYNKIYMGYVKDNRDVQKMGRLSVSIPEIGGRPDDPKTWHLCNYVSPFAGSTRVDDNIKNGRDFKSSQRSYGMWMIPPDLDNIVIVAFIDGDPLQGIWLGCMYQQYMNNSVPGYASSQSFGLGWESKTEERCDPIDFNDSIVNPPTIEYNKKDEGITAPDPKRPRFEPLYTGICNQGLYRDFERGPTDASARRESPSQIFGFSTPRGHQMYIDDGKIQQDQDENVSFKDNQAVRKDDLGYIRFRTRSGTQILINDNLGYIYMNTNNGSSWFELSEQGINMYTAKDFNIRAQGDFNLRVDGETNMELLGDTNIRTVSNLNILSESQINIHNESVSGCGNPEGISILTTGDYNLRADNGIRIDSGAFYTEKACDYIAEQAPKIYNNSLKVEDAIPPIKLNPVIRFDRKLSPCCYPRKQIDCNSIIRQKSIVTHEPWGFHPKSEVELDNGKAVNNCVNTPDNSKPFTATNRFPKALELPPDGKDNSQVTVEFSKELTNGELEFKVSSGYTVVTKIQAVSPGGVAGDPTSPFLTIQDAIDKLTKEYSSKPPLPGFTLSGPISSIPNVTFENPFALQNIPPTELSPGETSLSDKVVRLCKEKINLYLQVPNLFVKKVGINVNCVLNGNVNDMLDYMESSSEWTKTKSASIIQQQANKDYFCLVGIKSSMKNIPSDDGNIAIITKGSIGDNLLPSGYWVNNGAAFENKNIKELFNEKDLNSITFYYKPINAIDEEAIEV